MRVVVLWRWLEECPISYCAFFAAAVTAFGGAADIWRFKSIFEFAKVTPARAAFELA
jgi:hypothetical protein